MKIKKILAFTASLMLASSFVGCGDKESSSAPESAEEKIPATEAASAADATEAGAEASTEPETEAPTEHISPTETVSTTLSVNQSIGTVIEKTEGSNTVKLPLADFIEEGDKISSFTFTIYSSSDANIGEFKGGCGISVDAECDAATDEGWYQSEDFTAPTEGTYGEIKWSVPGDAADHISAGGDVLFGYWWGDADSIIVDSVTCTFTRTREIPCDGTVSQQVGSSVGYGDTDNTIKVPTDFLPENSVPQAVTYNFSSTGGFGKFVGAFGYESSLGYYQSPDVAEFTDSSSLSLTWLLPDEAKSYAAEDGELMLGYWWSEQPTISLDSVSVKYSLSSGTAAAQPEKKPDETDIQASVTGFRSSKEIVDDIKVGWNLGNTLESYDTGKTGLATETGWGNPKTTEDMIKAVKDAGFNAVRIPVTWGEHMDGDTIQAEWMDRVQEVVDYAYNNDMYVILNMHHDDYIWFNPSDGEYSADSAKLKKIWEQIAANFKNYGDRLIFEGMNEARTVGSANEWMGGTAAERSVVNKYQQDFVDTVRASGGNNADRTLIVTGYAASAEDVAMNDIIVPNDDHIIVSLHYYAPWKFSDGQSTVFGQTEKDELDAKFASMKKKFIDKGVPLIIDEFGCVAAADDSTRGEYYRYYISAANAQGIKCFVWDNGVAKGEGAYGIFNRKDLTWNETIKNGIIEGTK